MLQAAIFVREEVIGNPLSHSGIVGYIPLSHSGIVEYTYHIKDSEFSEVIKVSGVPSCISREMAVFRVYLSRQEAVAKNIALLYRSYVGESTIPVGLGRAGEKWIIDDSNLIDKLYPDLEYGKRYQPCILNQFRRTFLTPKTKQ